MPTAIHNDYDGPIDDPVDGYDEKIGNIASHAPITDAQWQQLADQTGLTTTTIKTNYPPERLD